MSSAWRRISAAPAKGSSVSAAAPGASATRTPAQRQKRQRLEALFSTAAEHYARAPPGLPAVLFEAFLAAYGRPLTAIEEARLVIDAAMDAVSGIAYRVAHDDPELTERGRRTLARLRAEHRAPLLPTGDAT